MMEPIAQTNLQLYNQLRREGRPAGDLALIRRCYERSVELYSGAFQGDGKPFVAHTVGVASIMGQLGVPSVVVGAACIHNVYGNGNFGDGSWITEFTGRHGKALIEIANRLGHPQLAAALADAFGQTALQGVPPELKRDERHTAIELVMPQSCMRRPRIAAMERLNQINRKFLHR